MPQVSIASGTSPARKFDRARDTPFPACTRVVVPAAVNEIAGHVFRLAEGRRFAHKRGRCAKGGRPSLFSSKGGGHRTREDPLPAARPDPDYFVT